ncbi:MAG: damage-inducible protein DinB [Candidatus Glassbacteria bacterium]|nr:damage-inducible protein DinB [Candidatus Glassbacteria bacterium]
MKQLIEKLYDWNFWGNRRALEMLRENGGGTENMLGLMSHILASEQIWLTRLQGEDSSYIEIFPAFDDERCAAVLDGNERDWRKYLMALEGEKLFYLLKYKNQFGVEYETAVADILMHVSSHGHYHRAQIAAAARQAGWKTVNTDYISFVRELERAGRAH